MADFSDPLGTLVTSRHIKAGYSVMTAGQTTLTIAHAVGDAAYILLISPQWLTTWRETTHGNASSTVEFGTPAVGGEQCRWAIAF